MFDLQREIDAWSKKAYDGPCRGRAASLDEWKDHVHCEIERLVAEGRTPEEAFRLATTRLGEAAPVGCRRRSGVASNRARIALAIVWASVIIATALLLTTDGRRETSSYLLLFALIPAWWSSDLVLSRHLRAAGDH